jgi:hypothetical protein
MSARIPHIRSAEILAYDADAVTVAVAFLRPMDKRNSGHVAFVCPFCGAVHLHGTSDGFGNGDGHRVPHCARRHHAPHPYTPHPAMQAIAAQLAAHWQFILREVEDPARAGTFPKELQRRIEARCPKAAP